MTTFDVPVDDLVFLRVDVCLSQRRFGQHVLARLKYKNIQQKRPTLHFYLEKRL